MDCNDSVSAALIRKENSNGAFKTTAHQLTGLLPFSGPPKGFHHPIAEITGAYTNLCAAFIGKDGVFLKDAQWGFRIQPHDQAALSRLTGSEQVALFLCQPVDNSVATPCLRNSRVGQRAPPEAKRTLD